MKKLKYLLFIIPFLFITNVKAVNLGTPLTAVDYVDNSSDSGNANISTWWNSDYYEAPFRLGYFTSATPEAYKMAFLWSNSNLCSNQNIQITGYIGGLWNFFTENSYSFGAINNNQNMTCALTMEDNSRLKYTCVGIGGGSLYISLQQNSFSSHNNYQIGVSRNQDVTCDVTNLEIMQQNILNTQNIINNQTNNTNSIINNQNSNTQDIINNQNQNTQQQIESQLVCKSSNTYSTNTSGYLNSSGAISPGSSIVTSDFIPIPFKILPKSVGSTIRVCFYSSQSSNSFISCITNDNMSIDVPLNIPTNAKYFRFSKVSSSNRPFYDICYNGNQALTDSITSEDPPNTTGELEDLDSSVASDTPISDLILLPITLINTFINGINSSCSPVNLGNLYGTDLIFPCIDLETRLGSNLWNKIDILFSIFMCYNIGMLFITAFNGITSLRDDFDSLYQPKHADTGYQPKHGG